MCETCGCSGDGSVRVGERLGGEAVAPHHHHSHSHGGHGHHHDHARDHGHTHSHGTGAVISVEQDVLAKNNRLAERNRGWLAGRDLLALNLVSSPGAGKTTLLERTLRDLAGEQVVSVIEGDQETDRDARRIQAAGGRVVQVNTGTGCHLDAAMVSHALEHLDPPPHSLVLIENVGNLVCPALFDLGERAKVLIVSVTEGEDKPVKYPHMFRACRLLLLNKIDLLPYVPFDVARFQEYVRQVNPDLRTLQVSATRGDGLDEWYSWLRAQTAGAPVPAQTA